MKYWLVNSDPDNGLLWPLYNLVVPWVFHLGPGGGTFKNRWKNIYRQKPLKLLKRILADQSYL